MSQLIEINCITALPLHKSKSLLIHDNGCSTKLFSTKSPSPIQVVPQGGSIILRCEELSKSYTGTPQFEEISFNLCKGQRVGLIKVYGAGKSTL